MSDTIIANALEHIKNELKEFNANFVAAQAPQAPSVPGRLTKSELHALLRAIEINIERKLLEKTGWGRNEVKHLIADVLWSTDLGYKYKEED